MHYQEILFLTTVYSFFPKIWIMSFFSKNRDNVYALVVLYFVFNGDFIIGGYIKGVGHILPTRSMESIYSHLFSAVYYMVFLQLSELSHFFLRSVQNKLTMFLNYKMILYSVSFFLNLNLHLSSSFNTARLNTRRRFLWNNVSSQISYLLCGDLA